MPTQRLLCTTSFLLSNHCVAKRGSVSFPFFVFGVIIFTLKFGNISHICSGFGFYMGHSFIVIAIIAMTMMLTMGTPSKLNPDGVRLKSDAIQLTSQIHALIHNINNYEMVFQRELSPLSWDDELRADNAIVPKSTDGLVWSIGNSASGRFICLERLSNSPYQYDLFESVSERVDFESFIADDCGATSNTPENEMSKVSLSVYYKQ